MDVTKTDRRLSSLNPKAQEAFNLFLDECKKNGLNVLVTEARRSQERQNYLYCQGRTVSQVVAKGISKEFAIKYCNPNAKQVTWTLTSNHKNGMAIDICKNVRGQEYSDSNFFKKCGAIAKKLGITWGGTWNTPDTPHFEIPTNWQPPKTQVKDEELIKAVNKIIQSGINLNAQQWNDMECIKLQYVPVLLSKLGGLNALISKKIISNSALWQQKKYNETHVRALLIKYANSL